MNFKPFRRDRDPDTHITTTRYHHPVSIIHAKPKPVIFVVVGQPTDLAVLGIPKEQAGTVIVWCEEIDTRVTVVLDHQIHPVTGRRTRRAIVDMHRVLGNSGPNTHIAGPRHIYNVHGIAICGIKRPHSCEGEIWNSSPRERRRDKDKDPSNNLGASLS